MALDVVSVRTRAICRIPQDTTVERDYMKQYVFPDVELRLRELGLTFDVVDLRWGMTDAFGDHHGATAGDPLPTSISL